MKKIGFYNNENENNYNNSQENIVQPKLNPRKSVVSVKFDSKNRTLSYYNDMFDLKVGDIVFVEGKFEGVMGRVVEVNYNFKIKLSDFKKVISVANTKIQGELFFADSHFIAFDRNVLPYEKIATWFIPPVNSEDEIVTSICDEKGFHLDEEINEFNVPYEIHQRGYEYYLCNKVVYLSVNKNKGKAIVMGTKAYEISFTYECGVVTNLVCDCFCNYPCKHQVATMLQLQDILNSIQNNYRENYEQSNYFAVISNKELISNTMSFGKKGSVTFNS